VRSVGPKIEENELGVEAFVTDGTVRKCVRCQQENLKGIYI
jgi:hypothetical protein